MSGIAIFSTIGHEVLKSVVMQISLPDIRGRLLGEGFREMHALYASAQFLLPFKGLSFPPFNVP